MAEENKSYWAGAQGLITSVAGLVFALTGAYYAWDQWNEKQIEKKAAAEAAASALAEAVPASAPGNAEPEKEQTEKSERPAKPEADSK